MTFEDQRIFSRVPIAVQAEYQFADRRAAAFTTADLLYHGSVVAAEAARELHRRSQERGRPA